MSPRGQEARPRRQHLSDTAAGHVRGLIMSGTLRPGDIVRPEIVGEELGISATPAREALQALRVEGFLSLVLGRGFQVAPLTGQDIRDVFSAHALIAGELAARAATNATGIELRELDALHHELIASAARGDHDLLEERNHQFHRQINLMAAAPRIAWTLGILSRYVPHRFYSEIPGWPEGTVSDHGSILEAIRSGSPEAARAAMQEHIVHAGGLLADNFDARVDPEVRGSAPSTPGAGRNTA